MKLWLADKKCILSCRCFRKGWILQISRTAPAFIPPHPSMLYILTYIFTFVSDISNRIKFHSTATVIPYFIPLLPIKRMERDP